MIDNTVLLWFAKADNDLKTAKDEIVTDNPATDTVCFHCQQCVEKYLKGFLVSKNEEIAKTHNLSVILKSCIAIDISFEGLREKEIDALTPYATTYRYPDDFYTPTIDEANDAISKAILVRIFVRDKTGEAHSAVKNNL